MGPQDKLQIAVFYFNEISATIVFNVPRKFSQLTVYGGVPCVVHALCKKLAVLHHREFGKFRRLEGCH